MFEVLEDAIIRRYGYEAEETIGFCTKCEEIEETLDSTKIENLLNMFENLMGL